MDRKVSVYYIFIMAKTHRKRSRSSKRRQHGGWGFLDFWSTTNNNSTNNNSTPGSGWFSSIFGNKPQTAPPSAPMSLSQEVIPPENTESANENELKSGINEPRNPENVGGKRGKRKSRSSRRKSSTQKKK